MHSLQDWADSVETDKYNMESDIIYYFWMLLYFKYN